MSNDDHPERARRPADVGPTDHRLTSGIEVEPNVGDGEAEDASDAVEPEDEGTPAWVSSVRSVLAGTLFVVFGVYLGLGQAEPDTGFAQLAVLVGLAVALWGFITWPR